MASRMRMGRSGLCFFKTGYVEEINCLRDAVHNGTKRWEDERDSALTVYQPTRGRTGSRGCGSRVWRERERV